MPSSRLVLKQIEAVRQVVQEEISGSAAGGGLYARGLSAEGFAGGYLQALDDVAGALYHGSPSDHRNYWRTARIKHPELFK